MKLIGIAGFAGSGKDTVADYLVTMYSFKRMAFADPLKDAVANIFTWPREMLQGHTPESRAWREQKDEWWSEKLGFEITPRIIMQIFGTEVVRDALHPGIWLLNTQRRIENARKFAQVAPTTSCDIVITDLRFPNEMKMIRDLGGQCWRIQRGPDPEWWGLLDDQIKESYPGVHYSESALSMCTFDKEINNDSTIGNLHRKVVKALS